MSYFSTTPEELEAQKVLKEKRLKAIQSFKRSLENMPTELDPGYMLPYIYDEYMETQKWSHEIPEIHFHSDWGVRIIPPFAGAVARFRVDKGDKSLSIYLDCYDKLGLYGGPYWEMYPNLDGDCSRYAMHDTKGLTNEISLILDYDIPKEVSGNPEMMEILTGSIPSEFPEYQEKLRERVKKYYQNSKADTENQGEEKR